MSTSRIEQVEGDVMTIEELMDAATPLPWIVNEQTPVTIMAPDGRISVSWTSTGGVADRKAEATAALIVTAVNALPETLALLKVARHAAEAIELSHIGPTPCALRLSMEALERALEGAS